VASSIPDGIIWFSNWLNLPSRTVAMGSTQSLTKMCTRNLSGCEGRPARKADILIANCELVVYKNMGASTSTTLLLPHVGEVSAIFSG
jgi:hypothetical protein